MSNIVHKIKVCSGFAGVMLCLVCRDEVAEAARCFWVGLVVDDDHHALWHCNV